MRLIVVVVVEVVELVVVSGSGIAGSGITLSKFKTHILKHFMDQDRINHVCTVN